MKRSIYFIGMAVPVVLAVLAAAWICLPGEDAVAVKDPASAMGIQEYSAPAAARDFTLKDYQGRTVSLKDYRGKTVMLNFWATWCGPCRVEMPSMERLYRQYKDRGFVVLAVAAGEERRNVKVFMENYRLTFPALVDSEDAVTESYNVWSIPVTYFINSSGEVIGKVHGSRQWDQEEAFQYVAALLKKS